MRSYKAGIYIAVTAAILLILDSCSNTAYKSQARYWQGRKHTSHYAKW
ncbi:MAG TPA: hypothetical protein VK174_12300 [Chitinophagales bacterium]|nr:hypothetical protein [Chitinophagales bacterium]HLP52453.1 hypothetical protein [Chitinophagales bacterium]